MEVVRTKEWLRGLIDEKVRTSNEKAKYIKNYIDGHSQEIALETSRTLVAERYYNTENDICTWDRFSEVNKRRGSDEKNPLRNADNRVPHNWHELLLNQKANYLSDAPYFDLGDKKVNEEINNALGVRFTKVLMDLIINAGNAGKAWLHYWNDSNGNFHFMSVHPSECIPVYSNIGDGELDYMIRSYPVTDSDGTASSCFEIWDEDGMYAFLKKGDDVNYRLVPYNIISMYDVGTGIQEENTNYYYHGSGRVPFERCGNNKNLTSDLKPIKALIDVYDKVYSGYINDLDDIQQMIFILTNYGGQDKEEFLEDLMYYKIVKMESDGVDDKSSLETLSLDIPVEARDSVLKMTKEQIFISGQGVNPNKENLNNNSGIALKFIYSLLDLKCNMLEVQFISAFENFIKQLYKSIYHKDFTDKIDITWSRSAISNDLEQAEILSRVYPFTSRESIAKHNPVVDNYEKELELRDEEDKKRLEEQNMTNSYKAQDIGKPKNTLKQAVGVDNQIRGKLKQEENQNAKN